ncbi:MAG: hypothetical protein DME26_09840, partial [Verrucomicrobia bacterium]
PHGCPFTRLGKGMVARAIHHHGQRSGRPFVVDEIGELSLASQTRLLHVLQDKQIERLGGEGRRIRVDVRVIAATNRSLEQMVAEGTFRQDLFFRLNVLPVRTPSLRERPEDIPLLADHFARKWAAHADRRVSGVSQEALAVFQKHAWPGNIRELEKTARIASKSQPPKRRICLLGLKHLIRRFCVSSRASGLKGLQSVEEPPLLAGAITLWLHVVCEGPFADGEARGETIFTGGPEVNAAVETTDSSLGGRRGETTKAAGHSRQEIRTGGKNDVVRAIEHG